jgi:hypothetical protein
MFFSVVYPRPVLVALYSFLVLGAGGVGIHVGELTNVTNEEAAAVASKLKAGAESWTGAPRILVDDLLWSECTRADQCLGDIRARMQCDTILLLKLQGGPTRIRVLAELHDARKTVERLSLDIPRAPSEMPAALAPLISEFFPKRAVPPAQIAMPLTTPRPEASTNPAASTIWPYLAIGAGLVAAGAGVVVGLGSRNVETRLDQESLTRAEIMELDNRAHQRALAADSLFGAAILGVAGGVLLILLD